MTEHSRLRGQPPEVRVWAHVDKAGPLWQGSHCWQWTARTFRNGYGCFTVSKRGGVEVRALAHRYMYELLCGPIPAGLTIDHLCRNRACCNPDHLEPVPQVENARRGLNGRLKTHCARGHLYTADNVYVDPQGNRHCKQCKRDAQRRYANKDLPPLGVCSVCGEPAHDRVRAPDGSVVQYCRHHHMEADGRLERLAAIVRARPLEGHCPHGHPYDEANTAWDRGHRRCKTCDRERHRARRQH